jgi:hypothetical protein
MNACVIMHNMIIDNEHGQTLDYSLYELMGRPVRVQRRGDRTANFLKSYHSIRDFDVHNNLQIDIMDECGSEMITKAEHKSEGIVCLCVI